MVRAKSSSFFAVSFLCFLGFGMASCGEPKLEVLTEKVGLFCKAEFVIHWDRNYANPFDFKEVEVTLEVVTPRRERQKIPAFWWNNFEMRSITHGGRKEEWLYPIGKPHWRARFAPMEIGKHSCQAIVRDQSGTFLSNRVSFECVPSKNKGFVRVSRKDPRFFEFTDGTPFFPIGHNLAFLYYGQYLRDTETIEGVFRRMRENGANFARIWAGAGDWALAIEWNKSAWMRTWEEKSPIISMPDGKKCVQIKGKKGTTQPVSPCARVALKPNTRYLLSVVAQTSEGTGAQVELNGRIFDIPPSLQWTKMRWEFTTGENEWWLNRLIFRLISEGTLWLAEVSLREVPDGLELLWEADLNRPEMGFYNLLDAFLLDKVVEAAEKTDMYLQLCLLSNPTRDLYMARLKDPKSPKYEEAIAYAKRIFRYAIARWGYSPAIAVWEFFNEMDPNLPTDRFYEEVGRYIKELDIYQRPVTTSAWHPNPRDWRHPQLDIANEHYYIRPEVEFWTDEVASVLARTHFLKSNTPENKPAIIAEFGLATKDWKRSPYMEQDAKLSHFHNSLWASALSGLSGTVMFWWWETLDKLNAYEHYKPLAKFLNGIQFTRGDLQPAKASVSEARIRIVGLQGKDCAYIWLFNSDTSWHKLIVEKVAPSPIKGAILELRGLVPATYQIQWWDTYEGEVIRISKVTAKKDELLINVPEFITNIACKIERASSGSQ
ncbi:MAG: hypothetical protein RMK18_11545 [Armatimonadota bacterium]|nr:hypothetical protein [Armatimonadota bacterium]MDW8026479.1 hypothetical protein [Armatimonadota bacterium]